MKSKTVYFFSFILLFFSCTKKKVEPKPAPAPVVNLGIQYISSTYSNVSLRYRLDGVHTPDSVCIGNTINLTYVKGDSLHLELISKIGFSQKSVTLPLTHKLLSSYDVNYIFSIPNSYSISVHQANYDGKLSCWLSYQRQYDQNNNEEMDTDSTIVAD